MRLCRVVLATLAAVLSGPACAQDLAPRAYLITPLDSNAITLTWSYYDGSVYFNGALPVTGTNGKYNIPVFSVYHSFSFFGRSANLAASVTPNPAGKVYGMADPILSGFLAADHVVASYSRAAGETVGSYSISATLSPAEVLGNYNITFNPAVLTIAPAGLLVTANDASMPEGGRCRRLPPATVTTYTATERGCWAAARV